MASHLRALRALLRAGCQERNRAICWTLFCPATSFPAVSSVLGLKAVPFPLRFIRRPNCFSRQRRQHFIGDGELRIAH